MARRYKRDSKGRFAGGYGPGSLGGKGSSGGGSSKSPSKSKSRPKKARRKLSTRQKTALTQLAVKGALLGGGYVAATKIMNKGEARLAAKKGLGPNAGLTPAQMAAKMTQTPEGFRAPASTPPGFRAASTRPGSSMTQTPKKRIVGPPPKVNPGKRVSRRTKINPGKRPPLRRPF